MNNKNKTGTWEYQITWQISILENLLNKKQEEIKQIIEPLNKIFKLEQSHLELSPKRVMLTLNSKEQLNMSKAMKQIEKQLMKEGIELKVKTTEYKLPLIMTNSNVRASEDIRLSKLIEAIQYGDYYDLDESFTDTLQAFKTYLKARKLAVIEQGEHLFLIDKEALKGEINLNCFECTKVHRYGCCSGSPCASSDKNRVLFDQHLLSIEEAMKKLNPRNYEEMIASGGLVTANGMLRAYNGHCSLLVEHEGSYKCIAHHYAIEQQIPVYDLCPLSCLMYPLEIMELTTDKRKKMILLTSVLEEAFASQFGRWGSYKSLEVELRCINKAAYNEMFKKADYKQVYKVNQELISHEFGQHIYEELERILE